MILVLDIVVADYGWHGGPLAGGQRSGGPLLRKLLAAACPGKSFFQPHTAASVRLPQGRGLNWAATRPQHPVPMTISSDRGLWAHARRVQEFLK